MSTITEIQEAIGRLPAKEKSALAAWLQSQDEPVLSKSEEAALLARLDKAAAELDAGEGVPLERVREKIRGWAGKYFSHRKRSTSWSRLFVSSRKTIRRLRNASAIISSIVPNCSPISPNWECRIRNDRTFDASLQTLLHLLSCPSKAAGC